MEKATGVLKKNCYKWYIFWCNNASLSRIDNPKNNFLVLVERPTEGVSCIAGAT